MTIQACKVYVMQLLACGTIFSKMNITDATITWTLPPPQRGPLQTSDNTIRRTIQQVINGSSEAHLIWDFTFSGEKFDRATFQIDNVRIGKKTSSGAVSIDPTGNFQEHFNISRGDPATLIIYNVTEADEAVFSCCVETDIKEWTDEIEVQIVAPPVISVIFGERTVNDSDLVNLICKAGGKPTPNITWTSVSDNSSVTFPFTITGKEDEGLYRCTADNGIGNPVSRDVFVTVQYYRPIETNLRTSLRDKAIVANTSFSITCSSKANPPAKYRFYKDQANVFNDTTGSNVSVITTSLSERTEKVNYSCTPFNDFGDGLSDGLTLTMLYAPDATTLTTVPSNRTLLRDTIMTLYCQTVASPKAEFHFYFNGKFIGNSSTGVLSVSVKEEGVYTCVPTNTVGTGDNATVGITVVVAASVEILFQTAIVVEGGSLVLACDASGKPQPSVTWTELGSSEVLSNTSSLTIVNVSRPGTPDNMIQYQCTSSNGVGTPGTATATISVHYPPSITNQGDETFNVEVRKEVKFLCLGDGNPPPTVNWTSEDGIIDGTLRKNMNNVAFDANVDSSGLYLCTIKNYLGEDFKWFRVVVESKNILIMLTITNKGCNDDSQEISEQLRTNVDELLRPHKQLKAVKLIDVRCGSVTVYLSLEFNENVKITEVLSVLKNATSPETKGFGEFDVDSGSIRAISQDELPTDSFIGTTVSPINTQDPTGDKQCECSCKDGLFGAIIGILVFIIIILIIYILWLHKKGTSGTSRTKRRYEDVRGVYDNEIALSDVEASNVVPTNSTQPRSEYMDLTEATTENSETKRSAQSADYAPLHPLTLSWEVARQHLTIEKIIGKGAFGQVAKGTAIGLRGKPGKTTVAVKMLKYNSPESDRRDLLKELDTMKQLKPHPHVIKLLGCVTETEPLMVIIEYVPYGDLLGYLRKSRGLNDTYYKDPDIKPETSLTSQQLMKFAWQIADGMSYLSSKSIIHRDLAARNVLVGERETCKVTDFGMARDVQQENIYERKTKGRLPVKWTAYEALLYGTYTTKSDIWSYGVVLYEIFTIGGSPYPRMNGKRIANLLQEGYRMPKPQHVDDKLYEIMLKCWQNDPDVRPTFSDLKTQLKDMENQHRRLINMKMYDRQFYANLEDLVV